MTFWEVDILLQIDILLEEKYLLICQRFFKRISIFQNVIDGPDRHLSKEKKSLQTLMVAMSSELLQLMQLQMMK